MASRPTSSLLSRRRNSGVSLIEHEHDLHVLSQSTTTIAVSHRSRRKTIVYRATFFISIPELHPYVQRRRKDPILFCDFLFLSRCHASTCERASKARKRAFFVPGIYLFFSVFFFSPLSLILVDTGCLPTRAKQAGKKKGEGEKRCRRRRRRQSVCRKIQNRHSTSDLN